MEEKRGKIQRQHREHHALLIMFTLVENLKYIIGEYFFTKYEV
jgi:hypothetical protein